MHAASAVLALAAAAVALPRPATLPHATFYYEVSSSIRRVKDGCRVCYGEECLMLEPARCEYYLEVDEIMDHPDRGGEGSQIDGMINELAEQATMSWLAQDCIPLISSHTTCNKENICIGCVSCHCNTAGRWSCDEVQRCRAEPPAEVSHRTLVAVIEKLLENEKKARRKRLVEETDIPDGKLIGLSDIADWLYDATPTYMGSTTGPNELTTENAEIVKKHHTVSQTATQFTTLNTSKEAEYLGFEEVLKNIANDQIYKRRKSQLNENSEAVLDYMDLEDIVTTGNNTSVNFIQNIEEEKNVTESTSDGKFVVDLYPREYRHNYDDYNVTEHEKAYLLPKENNTIDYNMLPESNDLDSMNIKKRDVSSVTDLNNITLFDNTTQDTTVTFSSIKTTTQKSNDLENNVLKPLTNIINDKESEVKELIKIRENLVSIMEVFHNNTGINITKESEKTNGSGTHFSIFKLNLYPEIQEDLRNINPNVMSKHLYKLKRDIYEVFRDISMIQKLSKTEGLPDDLRILIHSMKYYVSKQGNFRDFKKNETLLQNFHETRRLWIKKNPTTQRSLIRQFVDILEEIDKAEPLSNVFSSSSMSSKKVVKRVIKQNLDDEFSLPGFKTYDSEYNLTDDLKTIGMSWPQLTAKLANSAPHEKLYALKLLHFALAGDMNKMANAIALINFAHSRRMTPIETPLAEEMIDKVNSGLLSIKHKIQLLIKYQKMHKQNQSLEQANVKQHKKESFLKRIIKMFRSSKNDVIDMVKNEVPKTEIFRTIAKKKLHELSKKNVSDDEQTMLKWQRAMNISRRKKRDVGTRVKTMKNRIINILPKYLRSKINPATVKHKYKNRSVTKKKKTNNHKKSHREKANKKTTASKNRKTSVESTKSTITTAAKARVIALPS